MAGLVWSIFWIWLTVQLVIAHNALLSYGMRRVSTDVFSCATSDTSQWRKGDCTWPRLDLYGPNQVDWICLQQPQHQEDISPCLTPSQDF